MRLNFAIREWLQLYYYDILHIGPKKGFSYEAGPWGLVTNLSITLGSSINTLNLEKIPVIVNCSFVIPPFAYLSFNIFGAS